MKWGLTPILLQDGFNWKGVALSALSAGITNGLDTPALLGGKGWEMTAARMATANALTQGVAVVTGLQSSFDWRGVAASAAGGAVGSVVGDALGMNSQSFAKGFGDQFGARLATGLAAGAAAAVMRGGRVSIQQVATDAFGNALGGSLAAAMNSPDTQESSLYSLGSGKSGQGLQAPAGWGSPGWSSNSAGYDQLVGAFSNPGAVDRSNDVLFAAGPGYNGGTGSDMSDRDANIARLLRMANEPEAMGAEVPFRVQINGVGSTGAVDMAPTRANAIRLGLMGPDGQTDGAWSSPVAPQSNVVRVPLPPLGSSVMGPSLPEVENAYRPLEGLFQGRYNMAVHGLQNPSSSFIDKAYYTVAGAAALPLAVLETPVTSLYNFYNNADVAGQYLARGDLSTDPRDANIARLSAVIHATDAINGLLGPATLVQPRSLLSTPTPRAGSVVDNMLADSEILSNRASGANELSPRSVSIQNTVLDQPRIGFGERGFGSGNKVDLVSNRIVLDAQGQRLEIGYPSNPGRPYATQEFPSTSRSHGFTDIVDNYAGDASSFSMRDGMTLHQLGGSLGGTIGRFEWIVDPRLGGVTHRMFVPNGTINGIPVKP